MIRTRLASALAMAALAAILLPSPLRATITFERAYGGISYDVGVSVQQTTDDGYIATGYFGSGYDAVYLIKTNPSGDTQWTRIYDWTNSEVGTSVRQTSNGGYIVAGCTNSFGAGDYDVYLLKFDASGDTEWTRTYGGALDEYGYSMQQTTDDGYIVAGYVRPPGGHGDAYLVKTDAAGDTQWTRTYGSSRDDRSNLVQQTTDSGYILVGCAGSDIWLIKTDAAGDTQWTRTYGGTGIEVGYSGQQTSDGGYIVVGCTESFGAGRYDVYLIKTDAVGDTQWTRTYGTAGDESGVSVEQTTDGGYVVTGFSQPFGDDEDAFVIKTDAAGDTQWTRVYVGWANDGGYFVQQTSDGGYIVAGWTESFGEGSSDVYLLKTDSWGQVGVAEPTESPSRPIALSLSCEPNPCRSSTILHLTSGPLDHSTAVLRMYDSQGRMVLSREVSTSSFPLSTSGLPSGVYVIRCDAAGEHATARVVLQR